MAEVRERGEQCFAGLCHTLYIYIYIASHERDGALVRWGWGVGLLPWPRAKHPSAPWKIDTGVQWQVLVWDPLGSYLRLSAHGEERSRRATFCGLKVIYPLEQETKLSARQARGGAAPEVRTGCKDLGWAGGRARWQPSRTAMLISAPAPCLKNRELGSALGFPPPALRFR